MDQLEEPHDLLIETDVISSEEKAQILEQVTDGFIGRSEDMYDLGQLSAKSSGLVLPLSIAFIVILCTIFILLFSGPLINRNNEKLSTNNFLNTSSSEWGVLNVYMEQSTKKLENKDTEIIGYKEKIVNYDIKINTLKDLLRIKTETEKKLKEERSKLSVEGISEEDIVFKINVLEENLKSELTPAMITFYNLSIDDINHQIDIVLEDKIESEKNLKISLGEYDLLVIEKEELEEDIKQKSNNISQVTDAVEAMKIMVKVNSQYEIDTIVREQINNLYNDFFLKIKEKDYNIAIEKIALIRTMIEDGLQAEIYTDRIKFNLHISILNLFDDYINNFLIKNKGDNDEIPEIVSILDNISILTERVLNSSSINDSESAKEDLRAAISSVSEIERAFFALSSIDEQTKVVNNSLEEDKKDITQSIVEEINSSEELILLGLISSINFDQISIALLVEIDIKTGTKFYIFKKDDYKTERVLGSGTIFDILENTVSGKLESLFISSSKPAADDLIYIKLDIDS